jgi:predicted metal-dependent peptidase
MAIDQYGRIYYDPGLFESWSLDNVAAVILHELLHKLVRHVKRGTRIPGLLPDKWNVAADLEINQMLLEDGLTLPELPAPKNWNEQASGPWSGKPCLPSTVTGYQMVANSNGELELQNLPVPPGLTAEEYYQILITEPPPPLPPEQPPEPEDGDGDTPNPEPSDDDSESEDGESEDGEQPGKSGPGQPNPLGGNDGSGVDGEQEAWEQGPPSTEAPGQSDIEQELYSREFARQLETTGKGGAGLKRWAGKLNEPSQIPWDQKLRAIVRDAVERRSGYDDTTFAVPNRRQWGLWDAGYEVCLPSGVSPIPEVFCVIDTSGSMTDDVLQTILVEIKAVCMAVNAPVKTVCVDDQCYEVQKIEDTKLIRTTGGGGTDMRLGIELARKQTPVPSVCIVLTDGYTPWPDSSIHGMAVIACITKGGTTSGIPSFISSVSL